MEIADQDFCLKLFTAIETTLEDGFGFPKNIAQAIIKITLDDAKEETHDGVKGNRNVDLVVPIYEKAIEIFKEKQKLHN